MSSKMCASYSFLNFIPKININGLHLISTVCTTVVPMDNVICSALHCFKMAEIVQSKIYFNCKCTQNVKIGKVFFHLQVLSKYFG